MMHSRLLRLLALACLSTLVMLSDDFLQQCYTSNNRAELELSYVAALWAFNLALWITGRRWFVMPIIALFAGMQLLQLSHISFIGQPLSPVDISRLNSEWGEVSAVIPSAAHDHWPVFLAWGLPWSAVAMLFWRCLPTSRIRGAGLAMLMVIVALASKPDRALKRNMTFFMPGPTRSALHNSLNAFSFYVMRMSFGRDRVERPVFVPYRVERMAQANMPDHLWVIMGESVRGDRLGVYGYPRNNTPFLTGLLKQGRLAAIPGQAATVATGSTLPLFMNGIDEPGNIPELERKQTNLFKLARASGYRTFWLSAQESKLMSHIGEQWLDWHSTREDAPLSYARLGDEALLEQIDRMPAARRDFGVIHTRSVHIPYQHAYQHDASFRRPWSDGPELPVNVRQANQYDNALVYLDRLISRIMARAARLPGTTMVIITSDHGQMLGEQGRWGHNVLVPAVASVPMLLFASNGQPAWPQLDVMTHNDLHAWLAARMGWQIHNPNRVPGVSWFHGNNPFGDNLYVEISRANGHVKWAPARQISQSTSLKARD